MTATQTQLATSELATLFMGKEKAYQQSLVENPQNPYGVSRMPFLLTTDYSWKYNPAGSEYILCNINPTQASWTFSLRRTLQKLRHYTVVHTEKRKTGMGSKTGYYEDARLDLTFDTGNLMSFRFLWNQNAVVSPAITNPQLASEILNTNANGEFDFAFAGSKVASAGRTSLYRLLAMLGEAPNIGPGVANYFYVIYHSLLFPLLTVKSIVDPASIGSIQESAEDPAHTQYTLSLNVVRTIPDYDDYQAMSQRASDFDTLGYVPTPKATTTT